MILCVIDQPEHLTPILTTRRENDSGGVTIVESTGLRRVTDQPYVLMRYAFGSSNLVTCSAATRLICLPSA